MKSHGIRKLCDDVCGIDIGSEEHWVCVDPSRSTKPIRRFGAMTDDLIEIVTWLGSIGIRSVAMEATGIYWLELHRRLEEAGIEVLLADPRRTKSPRGRKTDMQDCQWIWELHAHGLLDGAFVPASSLQQIRSYLRYRVDRIEQAKASLQEMQRALSMMNIKVQHVIRDIAGKTGMAIVEAILAGERDPEVLAQHRDYRCRSPKEVFIKSLRGTWREEHLFFLQHSYDDYHHHRACITRCEERIEALLAQMPDRTNGAEPPPEKRTNGRNDFSFDAGAALFRITGIDLQTVDGIGSNTALSFLGEIGFDLSAWPTQSAFISWLGLCPNPKRSGGKQVGKGPTSANRAARILRHAAQGLKNHKGKMGEFFRRIMGRKGFRSAVRQTAHKLARIIYAMLSKGTNFDPDKLEPKRSAKAQRRRFKHLESELNKLGYVISPREMT